MPFRWVADDFTERDNFWIYPIARLRNGVTLEDARAEMKVIAAQLERAYPKANERTSASVFLLRDNASDRLRLLLMALAGGSLCILLIACINLASLLVARALSRQREFAVRCAIGAGRERLVRQMLTESVVLAGIGGLAGLGARDGRSAAHRTPGTAEPADCRDAASRCPRACHRAVHNARDGRWLRARSRAPSVADAGRCAPGRRSCRNQPADRAASVDAGRCAGNRHGRAADDVRPPSEGTVARAEYTIRASGSKTSRHSARHSPSLATCRPRGAAAFYRRVLGEVRHCQASRRRRTSASCR